MPGKKLSKNPPPSTSLASLSPTAAVPSSILNPSLPLPKLVVFDLDYTLWPLWVDTHVSPPLKAAPDHASATDRLGEEFSFYVDVPAVLQALPRAGVRMAVASRTSAPTIARDMLKALHLPAVAEVEGSRARKSVDAFDGGLEMYPGSKVKHFEAIQKRTGLPYEEMLFFDDESRNRDTESLGVTMWLVRDGVSWAEVEAGIEEWRKRRGHST